MLFQDQSQNKNIQGSICVKLIDVQNLFDGLSSKQMGKIDQSISNPNLYVEYSDLERKLIVFYEFLSKNNFLNKPHFKLKMESGKIINVYTSEVEYTKLKDKIENFVINNAPSNNSLINYLESYCDNKRLSLSQIYLDHTYIFYKYQQGLLDHNISVSFQKLHENKNKRVAILKYHQKRDGNVEKQFFLLQNGVPIKCLINGIEQPKVVSQLYCTGLEKRQRTAI